MLAAAGAVGLVLALGYDPFEPHPAGVREHGRAVLFEVLAQADVGAAGNRLQDAPQQSLAVDERHVPQVRAVAIQ